MIKFFKMQGIGNDYIFFDCMKHKAYNSLNFSQLAKKLSERRFSVGSDGVVVLRKSKYFDVTMQIYNSDGSSAKMCGNAIRCVALYMYKTKKIENLIIEVSDRVVETEIVNSNKNCANVRAKLGKISFVKKIDVPFDDKNIELNVATLNNLHCVVFVKDFDFDIVKGGQFISSLPEFEDGVNVEFVKIIDKTNIEVKVYERGSGRTLACGSGACASAYLACYYDYVNKNTDIQVELEGGKLLVNIDKNDNVEMTGEAKFIYYGELELL